MLSTIFWSCWQPCMNAFHASLSTTDVRWSVKAFNICIIARRLQALIDSQVLPNPSSDMNLPCFAYNKYLKVKVWADQVGLDTTGKLMRWCECNYAVCVAFAVEAVCSIQAAMVPPRCRPRPPSPSPKKLSFVINIWVQCIWMCQTVCDTIWPISMVCNDILRNIPESDPPRTYAHTYILTYFVSIDLRFRASH